MNAVSYKPHSALPVSGRGTSSFGLPSFFPAGRASQGCYTRAWGFVYQAVKKTSTILYDAHNAAERM